MKNLILLLTFVTAFLPSAATAQAVTPSPAMLEQFKNLPKAEQERIARQYGIDLSSFSHSGQQQTTEQNMQPTLAANERKPVKDDEAKTVGLDRENKAPERFGMKLFDGQVGSFTSVAAMPVPDSYRLGPDDSVQIQLYGKVNQQYELTVSREGELQIPQIGSISVAGLTYPQARELVSERISQAMLGVNVAVSMGKLRAINVFLAGEANQPGTYTLSALSSVTQALYAAGGVSDIGSLRQIEVRRGGDLVTVFDLYSLLLRGNADGDILLQHGDVIFIPTMAGVVQVQGEVRRPALYEIKNNETLTDVLAMAGGVTSEGYDAAASLERLNAQRQRELTNINLTSQRDLDLRVKIGDVVTVRKVSPRVNNQIALLGAVVRPGLYAYQNDMRISDIIQSLWGDLHATADPEYALVLRQIDLTQPEIVVLQFNLSKALSNPGAFDDVKLAPGDKVLVFNYANESYQRTALEKYFVDALQTERSDDESLAIMPEFNKLADEVLFEASVPQQQRTHVAQIRISDNLTSGQRQEKTPNFQLFSVEEIRYQQQERFKQVFSELLNNVLYNEDLMQLTPHLSRRELLYPVLQQLNKQARNGVQPDVVSISGEVLVPGEYPLAQNADLLALISAAGGVKASANLQRAELTRYWEGDKQSKVRQVSYLDVSLKSVLAQDERIDLQSRDNLNVFALPDWNQERIVEIRGEVRFPGRYPVRNGETLSSLLQRAGGVTAGAFTRGAVFTREMIKEREKLQLNKLLEQLKADVATRALSAEKSMINPADAIAMVKELEKQTPVGRFVVDLAGVVEGNLAADLELEDGDLLYIPRQNTAITVVGEVQYASSHRYKEGMTLEYYLQQAGGYRKRADEDAVYVIKADGSVMIPQKKQWFAVTEQQLAPGDTIVVPLDTEYKDSLSLWSQVTQIFYQSAVALAAISAL